jgi:crotonobetainyl-CoA:carnitine CoA-transferase CaiB-like acyl-CoA transferase
MHAVIGIMMALWSRGKGNSAGQIVDIALYESMFNLLEAVVPEYDGANVIRQPSGTTVTGIVPTNTYKCADGKFLVIGGNGDSIFSRLMAAIGRDDLANSIEYDSNLKRVDHEDEIDEILVSWCSKRSLKTAMAILERDRIPCGPVYSVVDMMGDKHFNARGLFEQVEINGESLKIPAIMPKLVDTPGGTDWAGPAVASHTDEILETIGFTSDEISDLKLSRVVTDSV